MPGEADARLWSTISPPLSPWILEAVSTMGFSKMTPVQASTIPIFLGNKDVVVEAVTGSGKTLAFLIPTIERLLRLKDGIQKGQVGAIIISPTRELASQIFTVCENLIKFHLASQSLESDIDNGNENPCPIRPQLLVGGGTSPAQDLRHFLTKSCNLLIATPGRLNDILASPYVHTSQFEVLILDEADRLLSMGFKDTLIKILARLPKQRRTGLFSASVTEAVEGVLTWAGIRNGVRVNVKVRGEKDEERRTPASLDIGYIITRPSQKLCYLRQILLSSTSTHMTTKPQKTIVYFATCHGVDYFAHLIPVLLPSYTIISLHGKQSSATRTKNFGQFVQTSSPTLLLTTDLAARGLDIPEVDLVVQLDPPQDPKQFLHRCGRSGRAGRRGRAIVLLTQGREEDFLPLLKVRKTPVRPISHDEILPPSDEQVASTLKRLRKVVGSDRAIYEKSMRGFVSWVRSYRSHIAASIFRIEDVDWTETAKGWALIKMPRMPELKNHPIVDLGLDVEIDVNKIAFKDKAREKQRQETLQNTDKIADEGKKKKMAKEDQEKKNTAWSGKLELKDEKDEKRGRKRKKKDVQRRAKMTNDERDEEDEWKGLVEEVKRIKREEREVEKDGSDDDVWDGID